MQLKVSQGFLTTYQQTFYQGNQGKGSPDQGQESLMIKTKKVC
jgi:hypothetical protein